MAPPSWVEVIYVIPLYGVSRGLNLNLSSVGGRSLKLTDYYRAESRRYLPDRAKIEARPCEAEARPSQLKKTASRPPRAEADASRTTSLLRGQTEPGLVAFYDIQPGNGADLLQPGARTGPHHADKIGLSTFGKWNRKLSKWGGSSSCFNGLCTILLLEGGTAVNFYSPVWPISGYLTCRYFFLDNMRLLDYISAHYKCGQL